MWFIFVKYFCHVFNFRCTCITFVSIYLKHSIWKDIFFEKQLPSPLMIKFRTDLQKIIKIKHDIVFSNPTKKQTNKQKLSFYINYLFHVTFPQSPSTVSVTFKFIVLAAVMGENTKSVWNNHKSWILHSQIYLFPYNCLICHCMVNSCQRFNCLLRDTENSWWLHGFVLFFRICLAQKGTEEIS